MSCSAVGVPIRCSSMWVTKIVRRCIERRIVVKSGQRLSGLMLQKCRDLEFFFMDLPECQNSRISASRRMAARRPGSQVELWDGVRADLTNLAIVAVIFVFIWVMKHS